ncbi:hypothetical protein BGW36DRAFT_399364 [Talaromyces proteolyticus]|uniref:Uncharacterized protein n=1 Tax=Talaromyces proteolyticus TaxID=1131652 RepID=A0AAD4KM15_9EURO|nr:uncharacterized protein BGW36DRAFT_399364 [Talaromyces proteolyticus]KAH8694249.1 hypothetical protein BGW36DRAFT_399364 [Talaromyces proteolyticus]
MSSAPSSGSALTRQSSRSNDLPSLCPSSAATSHRPFSFIRSASFNKPRPLTTSPIPEIEKEPIFDEIRDCDEAPYPQNNIKPLSAAGRSRSEGNTKKSLANSQSNGNSISLPHRHKWLNKLDPRCDTKLLEEQRKKVEREERERRKRKEEEGMLGDLMPKWVE